jgi:hypothetical protein
MTNVLAIRADKSAGNLDYTRDYNAVKQSTGPWKVNPKRLITDKCWVVLYRDDYPDVIATIEMPRFELGINRS